MDSTPHTVIPVDKVAVYFQRVVHPTIQYMPTVQHGFTVDAIFIVGGKLRFGHYHVNGLFYDDRHISPRRIYRGTQYGQYGLNEIYDGQVTHWAYLTDDEVPIQK
jgi:hypothetical protein